MKRSFTLCVMMFVIIAAPKKVISQQPPIYKFNNSVLQSGTANATGAVYRFANASTGIDALVTVTGMSGGISLRNIDRTADGYAEALQPEYRVSGNTNGYIDFTITFVTAGTDVAISQAIVAATGLDIDGSSHDGNLYEYNRIDMGGGTYEYNSYNSQVVIAQTGTAFTCTNVTGVLFGALVDTSAKEVMFSVTSTNVSSMTFRVGANNQTGSTSTRYASLYFKKFIYQHFPLAISNLLSFEGTADHNNVKLKWELSSAGTYKKIVLEKSNNATDFSQVVEYPIVSGEGNIKEYDYTDNTITGDIVFYRLKATEGSGKIEYSNILSFRFDSRIKAQLKVYPTFITSLATASLYVTESTGAVVYVTDFSGRVVKQQHVQLSVGSNTFTINGFERFLKGNYIISIRTNVSVFAQKVIVQ